MPEPKTAKGVKKEDPKKEEKEKLVQVAIRFLMNPEMSSASDEMKVSFLKKKGLSDEDIERAKQLVKEKLLLLEQQRQEQKEKEKEKENVKQKELPTQLKVTQLSEEVLAEQLAKAKQSNIIQLRNVRLTDIPLSVFNLDNLQVLIISFNKPTSIPDEIGKKKLTNLKIFHAVSCHLQNYQISDNLWKLENLKELNLSRNQLVYIDQAVTLKSLIKLDLSFNAIMHIPQEINQLIDLQLLDVSHNNLSSIPNTLKELTKLRRLAVNENIFNISDNQSLVRLASNPVEILSLLQDQIDL